MNSLHVAFTRQQSLYQLLAERQIQERRLELARLQEQMATGRRVNRPSDDPSAYATSQALRQLAQRYDQHERTLALGRAWLAATEDALATLVDLFNSAYEEGLRMATETAATADRATTANVLEKRLQAVLDQLNARHNGEYLFAGTRTTTQPFQLSGATVVYNGNNQTRLQEILPGLQIALNLPGNEVWEIDENGDGTPDFTLTEAWQDLINALRADDTNQIQAAMARLDAARNHLLDRIAQVGEITRRLSMAETELQDARLRLETQRSQLEDADFAEVAVKLQRNQLSLEATLQVTSRLLQTSLLNYLAP
ncbi:flagellar hook-associated protein FlgL [Rhodothermus profundi]|uniref:Flagellar hook-associated protein 3 FlgL n=1 Tax=Rhodothermus profundi TaxID=633813 RepID=A0A1M6QDF0_9BACT|nr:flagellar hook-associated protein FlgL [Rhodothermus profundi]SHK18324.1 flagellar hook-associated protein 3 FlgL [Rhodothermus profundi]